MSKQAKRQTKAAPKNKAVPVAEAKPTKNATAEQYAQALEHLIAEAVRECDAHAKALLIRAQEAIRALK